MKYNQISVFFPAYNEEENIEDVVLSVQKYLKKHFLKYQIIVINNGSNDNTKRIVKGLIEKDKNISIINYKVNQGYGGALRTGFSSARYRLVFYTDADNQFNILDLDKVLPLIKSCDIVSGYRIKRQDPLMRVLTSTIYNKIINLLFNLNIKDIDCSFKLYKKSVLDSLNLKSKTGLIDAEVLIKAKNKKYKIVQVGVNHYPRLKGQTSYEVGGRNRIIAFVRPSEIIAILREIVILRKDFK
jgi:glycosyltransferase involved in cell wall biosynthesis